MRERAVRRNRLCLTRLPEAPDTQSDADLLATVNELLSSIDCKAKAISAYRVGRKPGSYADKVAPMGVKTRPIIVTMPTWDDKYKRLASGSAEDRVLGDYKARPARPAGGGTTETV